jgi:transcriptional regulator with XRE-family HTH domain
MTESSNARAWRSSLSLTREQLSALTGYSPEAIYLFERGLGTTNKPHDPKAWQRYKLACLAVRFLRHYKTDLNQWEWS